MSTGAARPAPDGELLQHHRIAGLQHLGIGQAAVGHVGLHRIGAVEARPRAGAAADGLVILALRVAEGEVVHRALGGGEHAERAV